MFQNKKEMELSETIHSSLTFSNVKSKTKHIIPIYLNKTQLFKWTNKKQSLKKPQDVNLQALESSVTEKIGLNVLIKNKKNNTGSITFEYREIDQLNKIIEIIKSNY